ELGNLDASRRDEAQSLRRDGRERDQKRPRHRTRSRAVYQLHLGQQLAHELLVVAGAHHDLPTAAHPFGESIEPSTAVGGEPVDEILASRSQYEHIRRLIAEPAGRQLVDAVDSGELT